MKKTFFILLLISVTPFLGDSAYASLSSDCDLCKALLGQVDKECMVAMNCSDEQIIAIMEDTASMLPAMMANQARILIETYGYAMSQLYNIGHDVDTVCKELALCSSGGGTEPCPDCVGCNTTDWRAASTGYQARIYEAVCNCGVCNTKVEYRCADGFYGSSTNGSSGCIQCPSLNGVYAHSYPGSTTVTSCYIAEGVYVLDDSGTYVFTPNNCYYSE